MRQNVGKICRSIGFPGDSEFTRASGGPQNGGKITGMDILELSDINGPALMPPHPIICRVKEFYVSVFLSQIWQLFTTTLSLDLGVLSLM